MGPETQTEKHGNKHVLTGNSPAAISKIAPKTQGLCWLQKWATALKKMSRLSHTNSQTQVSKALFQENPYAEERFYIEKTKCRGKWRRGTGLGAFRKEENLLRTIHQNNRRGHSRALGKWGRNLSYIVNNKKIR